jgi:hypothetical protein
VDDVAARRDAVALLLRRHLGERRAAHLADERPEGLLHVPDLVVLVVGPLPVEAQHRDPPAVHHLGVELGVALSFGIISPRPESPIDAP